MADEIEPLETIGASEATLGRVRAQLSDIDRLGRGVGTALGGAFADLTLKGRSFESVLNGLALRLSRLALNAAFKPLEQSISSGLSGLFSGSLFSGGAIASAAPLPGASANASQIAGTFAAPITVNISSPDVDSFRRSETQIAAILARSVARGNRNF